MKFSKVVCWGIAIGVGMAGVGLDKPAMGAVIATYSDGGGFSGAGVAGGSGNVTLSGLDDNVLTLTGTNSGHSNGTATLTFTRATTTTTTIPGVIDLGSISLAESGSEDEGVAAGSQFTINVLFSNPSAGNAVESSASVNLDGTKAVATLLFNPTTTTFFTSNNQNFTITPTANPIVINQGESAEITGTIDYVPEPATMLGVPMMVMAGLRRWGRKRAG